MSIKKKILKVLPLHYYRVNRWYSQEGEDVILKDLFYSLGVKKGFFVDVGAHHPIRFSNTHLLYKSGWKGINFEPNISSGTAFKLFRKRDKTVHIGLGNQEGELDFYIFDEPAINSFDKELSEDRDKNTPYKLKKVVKIPIMRLESALDKYLPKGQHIDLMSIDVEGLDMEVMKSNNWNKYKPTVLLVEDMDFDCDNSQNSEVWNFAKELGYKLHGKTSRTLILIDKSFKKK
jgi:FkbM family methyltransferase